MNEGGDEETVVRVRGLPWSATVEDILKFFGKLKKKKKTLPKQFIAQPFHSLYSRFSFYLSRVKF